MIRAIKPVPYFEGEHIVEFMGEKAYDRSTFVQDEVLPWCLENVGPPVCGTKYRTFMGESMIFKDAVDADLCYLRFA